MQVTFTRTQMKALLATAIAVDGDFNGVKMILATNDLPLTGTDDLSAVELPDFPGYATSAALTWGTPHIDANGNAVVLSHAVEFAPDDVTTGVEVTQICLVNAAGDTLLASAMLDEPIVFLDTESVFTISFPLTFSQPGTVGDFVIP